jgi:sec-independent protein translocase protein TatC
VAVLKGAEREGASMALADHLRELRTRLLICVGTVAFMLIPAWFLYPWMVDILNAPYCDALTSIDPDASCKFLETNLLAPFTLRLRIAGYGALFLAMPVILWQLWRFIAPGLYKKERRYALAFTVTAMLLFIAGAVTAYFTLTQAVSFLVSIGGQDVEIRSGIENFVKLALFMMLAFGVGFQFPVVVVALQMIGVVTPERLASWWRQAIVLITLIAAGITPSGDPISMFALAVPMWLFYAISIGIGKLWNRRKRKKATREAEAERSRRAAKAARTEEPQAAGTDAAVADRSGADPAAVDRSDHGADDGTPSPDEGDGS